MTRLFLPQVRRGLKTIVTGSLRPFFILVFLILQIRQGILGRQGTACATVARARQSGPQRFGLCRWWAAVPRAAVVILYCGGIDSNVCSSSVLDRAVRGGVRAIYPWRGRRLGPVLQQGEGFVKCYVTRVKQECRVVVLGVGHAILRVLLVTRVHGFTAV